MIPVSNSQAPFTQQEIKTVFEPAAESVVSALYTALGKENAANVKNGPGEGQQAIRFIAEGTGDQFVIKMRPEEVRKKFIVAGLDQKVASLKGKTLQRFQVTLDLVGAKIMNGNSTIYGIIKHVEQDAGSDIRKSKIVQSFALFAVSKMK